MLANLDFLCYIRSINFLKMEKKKHIKVQEELERIRKANNKYCEQNNCEPSQYMLGQNNLIDEMIKFIEKL